MSLVPPVPSLEFAFEVSAELGALEDHGMTRVGHRRIIPVIGGTITGYFNGRSSRAGRTGRPCAQTVR